MTRNRDHPEMAVVNWWQKFVNYDIPAKVCIPWHAKVVKLWQLWNCDIDLRCLTFEPHGFFNQLKPASRSFFQRECYRKIIHNSWMKASADWKECLQCSQWNETKWRGRLNLGYGRYWTDLLDHINLTRCRAVLTVKVCR